MFASGINNAFTFGLRALAENQNAVASSMEKLATGKRINRASDDPSGMIAAEGHKVRIYSINKQLDSLARQESYLGAKEGGLSVISDQLIELQSLIVQAANSAGNSEEDEQNFTDQIDAVLGSIDRIARTTIFKGESVLAEYTTGSIHEELASLSEMVLDNPEKAQEIAQQAVDRVATTRGAIGNQLNGIDSDRRVLGEELINLTGSLSSIEDTDYAAEAAKLVRAQILEQASIAAIEISRQSAGQVLGLLQNATDFSNNR